MAVKSFSLKTHIWSVIFIVLIIIMGVEILLLVSENRKLRMALKASRGYLEVLNPGEMVPSLVGADRKGEEVTVEYPSTGQTVLFWFSAACASCEDNVEIWKDIYQKHNSREIRFFGVSTGEGKKTGVFVEKFQLEFPIIIVSDLALLNRYGVKVIPQTMLIDENGFVRKVWAGPLSENHRTEIEEMITSVSRSWEGGVSYETIKDG